MTGKHSFDISLRLLLTTVVISLAGSRWATYIGVPPIFISDVLLVLCLVSILFQKSRKTSIEPGGQKDFLVGLFVALFVIAIGRFLFSITEGFTILETLRDFVPFLYISVTFLSYVGTKALDETQRQKAFRILKGALFIHLAWCTLVSLLNLRAGIDILPVVFGAPVFSFRPDIDTAFVSILLILILKETSASKFSLKNVLALLACSYVILTSPARSSLIGLFFGIIWLLVNLIKSSSSSTGNTKKSNKFLVIALSVTSPVMLLAGSSGERLLATVGFGQNTTSAATSALGTQQARQLVWTQVIEWVNSNDIRSLVGSGFGINFLDVTHTLSLLEGTTYTGVRSPHNFFITILARLGWPAALFFMFTMLLVIWLSFRSIKEDSLSFLAMTVVLVLIPVSLLGVVLEAPFGAIPFYFAVGILLRRRIEAKNNKTLGEQD